jgi:hypothetical protein
MYFVCITRKRKLDTFGKGLLHKGKSIYLNAILISHIAITPPKHHGQTTNQYKFPEHHMATEIRVDKCPEFQEEK